MRHEAILGDLPRLVRLGLALERAARGDRRAIIYLRQEGWAEALDLWRPGASDLARRIADEVRRFLRQDADAVVDASYRVIDDPPWLAFRERLRRQRWGGHIILGPPGSGKTSLAVKLAWTWHRAHGYTVDAVNLYAEDRPPFARTITADTLIHRMSQLRAYLSDAAEPDPDEEEVRERPERSSPPPRRRVILIDEASLAIGRSGQDPTRLAAYTALTQGRHVEWLVVYVAQWARLIPLDLFGQATVWVKAPVGREADADRDLPVIRALWEKAEALRDVPASPFYRPPYNDLRAWAYVDAPALDYRGVVPFSPYSADKGEEP